MSIFWLFLPVAIIFGALEGMSRGQKLREADEARQKEVQAEMEAEAGLEQAADVWRILMPVYTKLRQAGATCWPWVHDCIKAIEKGEGGDPKEALAALIMTGDDLKGTRWDTDEMAEIFGKAAEKLAAMI